MINTTKLAGAAALLALLAVPGSSSAQQHQHRDSTRQGMMMQGSMGGGMGMGNMNMGGMMGGSGMMMNMMGMSPRVMRLQPNQVLSHADKLDLTDDQKAQIEQIGEAQLDTHMEHMAAMVARTNQIDSLLGAADVTEGEIRQWIDGSVEFYRDMHGRMIRDALAVREVLSAEQRNLALELPVDPSAMMMHNADMMMGQGKGQGMHGHKKP